MDPFTGVLLKGFLLQVQNNNVVVILFIMLILLNHLPMAPTFIWIYPLKLRFNLLCYQQMT